MIPLSVPSFNGNEKKYILDALEKGWVSTAGSYVTRFEEAMAAYLHVTSTTAVQSGTAAIHLALLLSQVHENQEVIVPTLTFIAAVNPVKYIGAEPVFMDCDDSLNMDCGKLENFLKRECIRTAKGVQNKRSKRIIKAIILVHIFGNMANMEQARALADQYDLTLIEDATEALGTCFTDGIYQGQFAGTIGDFGAYSFNGNKIITTGGGGMLTAKDPKAIKKARYLATQAKDDSVYYTHNEIGYNYRMTNLQAALGTAQLESLENFIALKIKNYQYYQKALKTMDDYELLSFHKKARNNHWFYSLLIKNHSISRDFLMRRLKEKGIETRPIWKLNHTQKRYEASQNYYIEKAPYYWKHVLNIPCSTTLCTKDMDYIIKAIKDL